MRGRPKRTFFRFCDEEKGGCGNRFTPDTRNCIFCNECLIKKEKERQERIRQAKKRKC